MPNYPINHHLYTSLWNKYRPAIVKLMVDAQEKPQEYKFQPHEFKDVNPREKGGYAFTMEIHNGKAQNNIKGSVVAQDLLLILQKSARAMELSETMKFEFVLDKQFNLTINQEAVVEETEEAPAPTEENTPEASGADVTTEEVEEDTEVTDEAQEVTAEETPEEEVTETEEKGS